MSDLSRNLLDVLGPFDVSAVAPVGLDRMESRLMVAGELRPSSDGGLLINMNPATGEQVGVVADASPDDAQAAVAAARRALSSTTWSSDSAFRAQCLRQLCSALERNASDFRTALVTEIGCPARMTFADQFDFAVTKLAFYSELLETYEFTDPLGDLPTFGAVLHRQLWREPVGLVAAITPWNLPVELMLAKVGGALAGGNAIILKPSPLAPWCATILGRIIVEETDIPAGIVAVLPSARMETAQVLTSSPDVDAIAFTGSTQTGEAVMRAASSKLTKVCLELGGKSPSVFLPDVDAAAVLPFAAGIAMFNAGQSCIMPSRMLVPIEQFEQCLDFAVEGLKAVHWGDPWSPDTFLGPLISSERRNEVLGIVSRSADQGARIVYGGNAIPGPGYFMEPTLIADLDGACEAARQEIFGPVVVMTPYTSVEHAIELANDTEFGLAAYVWGASAERAEQVGRRIRAGMVGINGGQFTSAEMPFGGMRRSGIGREWGVAGMEEFLETRTMATRLPLENGAPNEASGN